MDSSTLLRYEPLEILHPGEFLLEYIEANSWSQRDLARRSGLTPKTISEICNGKAPITPPTSLALERVLPRPAHFWLNLQRQFDEAEARLHEKSRLEQWADWIKKFPMKEMKRYGWLELEGTKEQKVSALLNFFGVSSPDSWDAVWRATNVAYRQTRRFRTTPEAISAWARAAELEAEQLDFEVQDFDEPQLRSLLGELRKQTNEPAERFVPVVQQLCAGVGVAVVWVPELPQTGISGCARWLTDNKALVALTLRYKTDDQMWLTFFHEIGHILLHRKRRCFIMDNADQDLADNVIDPQMQQEEEEANRFAEDTLVPPKDLHTFIERNNFSLESIKQFSERLGIGPGILVGRLQRAEILAHNQGNGLKRRFNWTIANTSID
jgi:HTH-type transcriptional regulator / antitoxin HigA